MRACKISFLALRSSLTTHASCRLKDSSAAALKYISPHFWCDFTLYEFSRHRKAVLVYIRARTHIISLGENRIRQILMNPSKSAPAFGLGFSDTHLPGNEEDTLARTAHPVLRAGSAALATSRGQTEPDRRMVAFTIPNVPLTPETEEGDFIGGNAQDGMARAPPPPKRVSRQSPEEKLQKSLVEYRFDEALLALDEGADIDVVVGLNGENFLTLAASSGEVEVIRALKASGANIHHRNKFGRTALMKAAGWGHAACAAALIQYEADVFARDVSGKTSVDWARMSGNAKCREVLEAEATRRINVMRHAHLTREREDEIRYLIDANRVLTEKARQALQERSSAALISLIRGASFRRSAFDEAVRYSGIDELYYVDAQTKAGWSPLTFACSSGAIDLISELVKCDVTLDMETKRGHTGLTWACTCGHVDVVQMMLELGASISMKSEKEGKTPLMHACYNGHAAVALKLIDAALALSLRQRRELVRDAGVDALDFEKAELLKDWSSFYSEWLNQKDHRGNRAMDYALEQTHEHVITVLEESESRIEERKAYLVQELEKANPTPCRFACGHVGRADQIIRHETWDCAHRYIDCPLGCGKRIQASSSKEHCKNVCPNRMLRCPNVYEGCLAVVKASELDLHANHQCLKRFVKCRLGCDESVRYDERSSHETQKCRKRIVPCDLGCGQHMMQQSLLHHQKYSCTKRLVSCTLGCGLMVEWQHLEEHVTKICSKPCKWKCGEVIGPKDKRVLHENHFCDHRPMQCKQGCGATFKAKDADEHHAVLCPMRPTPCTLECGRLIPFCKMEDHTQGERGDCPHRALFCRYDYVGKRLRVVVEQNTEIGGILPGEHVVVVEAFYPDEKRPIRVRLGRETHRCALTEFSSYDVLDAGTWTCGPMQAKCRLAHESSECKLQNTACPLGCGQVMPKHLIKDHVEKRCVNRIVLCSLGCGAQMKQKYQHKHEHAFCERRLVKCACDLEIPMHMLEEHAKKDCAAASVRCELGCGVYVARRDMKHHTCTICPKRVVECRFGCGVEKLWAEERENHETNLCRKRMLPCPLDCGKKCPADEIEGHVADTCPNKIVQCVCGEEMKRSELAQHCKWWCTHRYVSCVSCGARVQDFLLEKHEDEECPNRIVMCKNGCGTAIRLDLEEKHMTTACPRRIVECPNGCEDVVRAEELEAHLLVCDHRVIPCGANCKACARRLKNWVTGDVFSGMGRLVVCEPHGETALMWAASTGQVDVARKLLMYAGGANLDHESKFGFTALTRAAFRGKVKMVEYLVDEGADPNRESSRGQTALLEAIRRGQFSVTRYLLSKRVLIDVDNRHGLNPLTFCRQMGNMPMFEELDFGARFHEEQRQLFLAILMWEYEKVDKITKSGEMHVLDHHNILKEERSKLRELADDVRIDIEALEGEIEPRLPKLQSMVEAHSNELATAQAVLDKADAFGEEIRHLMRYTLEEAVHDATVALQSVRSNHMNMLMDITKPSRAMLNIMTAVCLLLSVEVKQVRDPNRAFKTIPDFWGTGCELLRDGKKMLHRLLHSMRGVVPSELVRKARHEFFCDPEFDYSCASDEADGYLMLESLAKWARAVDAYDYVTSKVTPLRRKESALRVQYNRMMLLIHDKEDKINGFRKRLSEYEEANNDAKSELAEIEAKLKDVGKRLWVAELLSYKTVGGHTALSWAAMAGNADIVRLLLDRGSALDYDDTFVHECVVLIQIVWRAYHRRQTRPPWTRELSRQYQLEKLAYDFKLLTKIKKIAGLRKQARSPIAAAVYNGNIEVVRALVSRGCNMRVRHILQPVGPPPCPFPSQSKSHNESLRLGNVPTKVLDKFASILDIAEIGVKEMKSSRWVYGLGWITQSKHEDTFEYVRDRWECAEEQRREAREADEGRAAVRMERDRVQALNKKMTEAFLREDFNRVIELVEEGATIDYQSEHGYTALTYAAFRGTRCTNRDGEDVLAVVLLLDRDFKLPAINKEIGRKHTALTLASRTGRLEVMEALLDRHADIEYETRDGKTALMHAAIAGKWDAVRFLVERGADVAHTDGNGKSAIEWARDSNFLGVMRTLAEYRYGNRGMVRASRGRAFELFTCAWGCGAKMKRSCLKDHEENDCPKRVVACPLGCGIKLLWAEEVEEHVKAKCPRRRIACPLKCKDGVEAHNVEEHVLHSCLERIVTCMPCGAEIKAKEVPHHLANDCPRRIVACDMCGESMEYKRYLNHKRKECPKRIVRCRFGCHADDMIAEQRDYHEANLCPCRPIKCKWDCNLVVQAQEIHRHQLEECPRRPVKCPLKCKQRIAAADLEEHLENECINRFVPCRAMCDKMIRVCDMDAHVAGDCDMRPVACPNGCGKMMIQRELEKHMQTSCIHRLVPCGLGCGEKHPLSQIAAHKENDCVKRRVQCTIGCTKVMPFDERSQHEMWECRFRMVYCGLGCKHTMQAKFKRRHEKRECKMRFVECGLGCGEKIREMDREAHEKHECLRRFRMSNKERAQTGFNML